ncbi:hypothetical protein P8452_34640 [Trifolium repens]|nr:hypothetical protein P8452_34640 [Trifolium repens]
MPAVLKIIHRRRSGRARRHSRRAHRRSVIVTTFCITEIKMTATRRRCNNKSVGEMDDGRKRRKKSHLTEDNNLRSLVWFLSFSYKEIRRLFESKTVNVRFGVSVSQTSKGLLL